MINLRYHIVSITAVFLALGIGVVLGQSLIQRYTIDTLEGRLDELGERLDRTDGENRLLRDELGDRDQLDARLAEEGRGIFAGHLDQVPVLVLSVQGSDDDLVADTRTSLRAAGAVVSGTLVFTARWDELTEGEVAELSDLLGRRLSSEQVARTVVLRRLGDELLAAAGPAPEPEPEPEPDPEPDAPGELEGDIGAGQVADPPGATSGEQPPAGSIDPDSGPSPDGEAASGDADEPPSVPTVELLPALIELGYLDFVPESAGSPLPSHGVRFVIVADDDATLDPARVLLPLLDAMTLGATGPLPVVVASPLVQVPASEDDDTVVLVSSTLVAGVRGSARLQPRVSTVDDADGFIGQASIVLALAAVADGEVGHHGLGEGAQSLLPVGAR